MPDINDSIELFLKTLESARSGNGVMEDKELGVPKVAGVTLRPDVDRWVIDYINDWSRGEGEKSTIFHKTSC